MIACLGPAIMAIMRLTSTQTTLLATTALGASIALALVLIRPTGVILGTVLAQFAGILALIAAISMVLFRAAEPSENPDRTANAVRSTGVVLAIVMVGGGLRLGLDAGNAAQISDDILVDRPDLGPGISLLRPNLRGATIVAPDRPHNPADLSATNRFDRTQRTRVFKVDTNASGFRGPNFEPSASGPRIGVLGDSFSFGWGVSYQDAWPAQLEKQSRVQTLNLGTPAANLDTLTVLAERQGQQWGLGLLLVCEWPMLRGADPVRHFVTQIRRIQAAISPAKVAVVLPPVSSFDPMKADIPKGLVQRLQASLGDIPMLDLNQAISQAGGSGVVLRQVGNIQQLVRVPSGDVMLSADSPPDRIAEPIIRAFEADLSLSEPLFFDGGHTTTLGNTVVATATASWLKSLGWIH